LKLEKEIYGVQGGTVTFPAPSIGSEVNSTQSEVKAKRGSTRLPPEAIDLTQ